MSNSALAVFRAGYFGAHAVFFWSKDELQPRPWPILQRSTYRTPTRAYLPDIALNQYEPDFRGGGNDIVRKRLPTPVLLSLLVHSNKRALSSNAFTVAVQSTLQYGVCSVYVFICTWYVFFRC